MTTAESVPSTPRGQYSRESIAASTDQLEFLIDTAPATGFDIDYVESLEEALRRMHARFRIHRARDLDAAESERQLPPELVETQDRLREEHTALLGHLDRLIRSVPSMADRPHDDNEVFILRVRELIAILRRHLAEEDRLLYLALWHDTGGEAG
jgi:hypothetical protein